MPFKSEKQKRAMYAAASGHSTLGIPQVVAQKFIADAPKSVKQVLAHRKPALPAMKMK